MMRKKYKRLRDYMFEQEKRVEDLAEATGRCVAYVSVRLNAHKSFEIDEAYKICDYLGIDHRELPTYFPPGGLSEN